MVHIGAAHSRIEDGLLLVESDVGGAIAGKLWYRLPTEIDPSAESMADALFPVGLVYAMATDGVLELDAPVSDHMLERADDIQDILLMWHGDTLRRAQIKVDGRGADTVTPADGVASCFSGGLDSFFTLHERADQISTLVYAHGFDIPLSRQDLYDTTASHLRRIAAEAGKNLIEIATNLKSLPGPLSWSRILHGPAIASLAMLLGSQHGTMLVPATHTYVDLFPWGTHPLLDPLWSTERVKVVHQGAYATRVQKTVTLVDDRLAQEHLRVCWKNTGDYNCNVCEKCNRTKVALRLAGALEKFRTFDNVVDVEALSRMRIGNHNSYAFAVENRDFAREVGDREIETALDTAIARFHRRNDPEQKRLRVIIRQLRETSAEQKTVIRDLRAELASRNSECLRQQKDADRARSELRRAQDQLARERTRKSVRLANAVGRGYRSLTARFTSRRRSA